MRRITTALISIGVVLMVSLATASLAGAESPWWGLHTGSRPAYLKAGVARSEVQELVTTTEESEGHPEQTAFEVSVGKGSAVNFATEPTAKEHPELKLVVISAASLQSALEAQYGAGGVSVEEATTGVDGNPLPAGTKRYLINSLAAHADLTLGPEEQVTAASLGIGATDAKVATKGHPDGQLYVSIENLGDATLSGAKVPAKITDTLPPGLKAVGVAGTEQAAEADFIGRVALPCALEGSGASASCTLNGNLPPFGELEMRIAVVVQGPVSGENEVSASGAEGFLCHQLPRGNVGAFTDSGCINGGGEEEVENSSGEKVKVKQHGGFERSSLGPVAPVSLRRPVTVSSAAPPFGVEDYELTEEEEGGAPVTQAGAHPFQQTTSIALNQGADSGSLENGQHQPHVNPIALAKDVRFPWPAGLIGNPSSFAQCTDEEFFRSTENGAADLCSAQSAVGVAAVTINEPANAGVVELTVPLFNLKPHVGEPARFGFDVPEGNAPVVIDTSVRTGSDYGVNVSVDNITQTAALLSSQVTVWGVPGDSRHDRQRGWSCLFESTGFIPAPTSVGGIGPCEGSGEQHPPPFLSLPTSCAGPLSSSVEGDSWSEPGPLATLASDQGPALDGCNRLPFEPEFNLQLEKTTASTPTGVTADLKFPQEETASGLAPSALKSTTVVLPEGLQLNAASAGGLEACTQSQAGIHNANESSCPNGSKLANVTVTTPLLPNPLKGGVYLASPQNFATGPQENPFGSLLAAYLIVKDPISGVLVKLAGKGELNETSGRITLSFESPEVPFEDAKFEFLAGERAPVATPAHCGTYTTQATFTPYSGTAPVDTETSFNITTGPGGGPCPAASLPFAPTLTAGTTNNTAASFSPLTATISRQDGEQFMNSVVLHMPPGVAGVIAGIPRCPEAQANAGTCSPASLIGHITASVGIGKDPFVVTGGQIFLTEGYKGAPFGLSLVTPAVAGPFNLGNVVVRARIEVDPTTAALTATSDEIPHILKGIPFQIKQINATVDRPGFTFNPTNCTPQNVTGTIGAVEGGSAEVSSRFQASGCGELKFAPTLTATVTGHNSKVNGAALTVKVSAKHGEANIHKVELQIPGSLPSRLTTLQKACTEKQFNLNPAGCPKASFIGTATARTPILAVPLKGPAIIVSHGGAGFPDVEFLLQGEGVHIVLDGKTDIKHGITYSRFQTVPDEPITSFETVLPQGPNSILGAFVKGKSQFNLCGHKLTIPTVMTGQNGAVIKKTTAVGLTGCRKAHTAKKKHGKAKKTTRHH